MTEPLFVQGSGGLNLTCERSLRNGRLGVAGKYEGSQRLRKTACPRGAASAPLGGYRSRQHEWHSHPGWGGPMVETTGHQMFGLWVSELTDTFKVGGDAWCRRGRCQFHASLSVSSPFRINIMKGLFAGLKGHRLSCPFAVY